MSERVHMMAPDGRTFTFKEWCDYLDKYEDFAECGEAYVGMDGKVFDIDGFRFNVHGCCLNPHVIMVGDRQLGFDIRTFRKWISNSDRRPVWYFNNFGYGHSCAGGYGHVEGDEDDAILEAIRTAIRHIESRLEWYEKADAMDREAWGYDTMGYGANIARCKKEIALAREEYDKRCQLTLF